MLLSVASVVSATIILYCNLPFYFAACSANNQSTVKLTGTNGTISTRPGYLPVNAVCYWIMTAPVGEVFRIQILVDSPNNKKLPCNGNLVRIYDGNSTGSDVRGEHNCNSDVFSTTYFISTGRNVLLEANTGSVANSTEIELEYQALPKEGKNPRGGSPVHWLYTGDIGMGRCDGRDFKHFALV